MRVKHEIKRPVITPPPRQKKNSSYCMYSYAVLKCLRLIGTMVCHMMRMNCVCVIFVIAFSWRRPMLLSSGRPKSRPELRACTDDRVLSNCVDMLCLKQCPQGLFSGATLMSTTGHSVLAALRNPGGSTISGVPVDEREYAKAMLEYSLQRPGSQGRRHLLCSASFPGSGKTVTLRFNCGWFVNQTQGIAVEMTFNGDQTLLYNGAETLISSRDFENALAVRMVHRLLVELGCAEGKAALACRRGGAVVHAVEQLEEPLNAAIAVMRCKLGAQPDTPVLLCVDELSKAVPTPVMPGGLSPRAALQLLTDRLDRDDTFYLAVSALGTEDIINLAIASNRHLMLQALGPLWFEDGLHPDAWQVLPVALRPFFDEDIRKLLPWDETATKVYDELTQLLVTAAGHPRRLEVLFRELSRFKPTSTPLATDRNNRAAWKVFIGELAAWLLKPRSPKSMTTVGQDIADTVSEIVVFPTDFSELVPVPAQEERIPEEKTAAAIEALAVRCVAPFIMPRTQDGKDRLKTVLQGVSKGFCQLLQVGTNTRNPQLLAFVPLPVLGGKHPDPEKLLPCGLAFFALHESIRKMYKPCEEGQEGKAFEEVLVACMLLLARGRDTFALSELCDQSNAGTGLGLELRGGPDVLLEHTDRWPAHQAVGITAKDVQPLLERLIASGAPGMIITVKEKYNIPGDFYGLFKTKNGKFVLFRGQVKDWFKNAVYSVGSGCHEDIVAQWRKHDHRAPHSVEVVVHGKHHTVRCVSLLFSANYLQQKVELGPLEGVVTIASMRRWLPTAAHALQTLTHLRQIFGWGERG